LAGGGCGFIDEMRQCLGQHDGAVLFGLLRLKFRKGESKELFSYKWVAVNATLDEGSTMSAVARGKALAKRPAMDKVMKSYVPTIACTLEVTHLDELTVEEIVKRVKQVSVLDGELIKPDAVEWVAPFIPAPALPAEVITPSEPVVMEEEVYDASSPAERAPKYDGPSVKADVTLVEDEKPVPTEAFNKMNAGYPADEAPTEEAAKEEVPAAPPADPLAKAEAPATTVQEVKAKAVDDLVRGGLGNELAKGDLVDIWSASENKWFTDGMIEEMRDTASTSHEGKPLPAGCAKIVYNNGARGKWLQPEVLNDRSVVKPSIRPPTFHGFMKKETHNILSEWHDRYFELRDGFLTWWITLDDSKAGSKPQCSLELVRLQMKASGSTSRFSLRTASSSGVVYNFDAAAKDDAHTVEEWTNALKQHAAFANRMYKFRTVTATGK